MILEGIEAVRGIELLSQPFEIGWSNNRVVYYKGKRYGCFRSMAHLEFVARHLGWDWKDVRIDEPASIDEWKSAERERGGSDE